MTIIKRVCFILLFCFSQSLLLMAQPSIEWQKCFGGSGYDNPGFGRPHKDIIQQTSDSGFVFAGITSSYDGDVTGFHGGCCYDYWVIKTDKNGNLQWQKCLGGTDWDEATCIQQTSDGGFVVGGFTWSDDGDVAANHGGTDYWVVKLNSLGVIDWEKSYGGGWNGSSQGYDQLYSIKQALDNGFILAGRSNSTNGNVTGLHGESDYWIVKLDSTGIIQWQKCLGGISYEQANSILVTNDGGYVIVGESRSNNGNVSGNHGESDYWVVKLNLSGSIQWQKCFGGSKDDIPKSISNTSDGGFVIAGNTNSYDGDIVGKYDTTSKVGWVIKIDSIGNLEWQKFVSGTAESAIQTHDGGFLVGGSVLPDDSSAYLLNYGSYWMIKLDSNHNFQWHSCDGNNNGGYCVSAIQTFDDKYVFLGFASSNGGDVSGAHGSNDIWLVKLSEINISKSNQSEICSLCNGTVTVSVSGGTPPYSYIWNTGATTDSVANLCHGTYIVTVTDASLNTGFCSEIIINDTVRVYGSQMPASCWVCPDGSATLFPFGGSGVYSYSWVGFPDTTQTLSGLPHGLVYGCVADSLGCITCVRIDVQSPVGIDELNNENEDIHLYPNPTTGKINLQIPKQFGQLKFIDIYSSIGKLVYSTKDSLEIDLTNLENGVYFIVVTNDVGNKLKTIVMKI